MSFDNFPPKLPEEQKLKSQQSEKTFEVFFNEISQRMIKIEKDYLLLKSELKKLAKSKNPAKNISNLAKKEEKKLNLEHSLFQYNRNESNIMKPEFIKFLNSCFNGKVK